MNFSNSFKRLNQIYGYIVDSSYGGRLINFDLFMISSIKSLTLSLSLSLSN